MDIVTSSSFFHHLPNYRHCLEEIYRVLKTGGTLLIFHEPCKLPKIFLYKLLTILHFKFESIRPNKWRQRLKIIFKQKFGKDAEELVVKLDKLESQAHCHYGFDPYNLLGKGFKIKAVKTYYPHYCLFNKFLEFCFPNQGPLFYIIAKKVQ